MSDEERKKSVNERGKIMIDNCMNKILAQEEKNRLSGSIIFWSTFLLIVAMIIYSLWS